MRVEPLEISHRRAEICRDSLDDPPQWFGLPEAKADYVAACAHLPMLCVYDADEAVGFLSLKAQTPFATEMHVLGVKRRWRRQGLGRLLIAAAAARARRDGAAFITVKTLAASHPDPHYAETRRFYEAMGFLPREVFPQLWGPENPCLLMVRSL